MPMIGAATSAITRRRPIASGVVVPTWTMNHARFAVFAVVMHVNVVHRKVVLAFVRVSMMITGAVPLAGISACHPTERAQRKDKHAQTTRPGYRRKHTHSSLLMHL